MIRNKMKEQLYSIIFETDTRAGRVFDIILIISVFCNSVLVIIESVDTISESYGLTISLIGWFFVVIFALEYLLRLYVVKNKWAYFLSFFGIIDLLAIMPLILGLFLPELRLLVVIRIFRLLRMFMIFKMGRYIDQSGQLIQALRASKPKITVFIFTILFIIVLVGSLMYIIEGPENGFTSIPISMYWAIVTISTVGYGDISPQTSMGKIVSSILMIVGYGIIAVPTGIISHELAQSSKDILRSCNSCNSKAYERDDKFCRKCGSTLNPL